MKREDYYTASEAMKLLGLTKTVFYQKVSAGHIPKVTQPGMKQSVYPKRDIDALVLAMNLAFETPSKFTFSKSSPGDQLEEMQIGILCFGQEYITPLPERIGFQEKSEFTFWSLKADGRVVGYISIFRFPEQFLDDLLTGKRIEREITVREILKFTRGEPFNVYIDVMAVDPRLPVHQQKYYAGLITGYFANQILDLLANGYQIRTLYTVTATPAGDNLVREAGFQLMEGKSLAPGRVAYQFALDEQGIEKLKQHSRIVRKGIYESRSRTS